MRALLVAPALLAACLDAPPGGIADGGAGASDGAVGADDAEPISCPGSLGLALTSEGDLAGWTPDNGPSCSSAVTGAGLEFSNSGMPSSCRLYRDQVLDMRGGNLLVRLNDAAPDLAMSISVVLGPPSSTSTTAAGSTSSATGASSCSASVCRAPAAATPPGAR